ncbi:MAG: hypothetical protein HKM07_03880 [Chlamydiae bacterium]|nr:hypothetical protein [Chlamydiota bacterium]
MAMRIPGLFSSSVSNDGAAASPNRSPSRYAQGLPDGQSNERLQTLMEGAIPVDLGAGQKRTAFEAGISPERTSNKLARMLPFTPPSGQSLSSLMPPPARREVRRVLNYDMPLQDVPSLSLPGEPVSVVVDRQATPNFSSPLPIESLGERHLDKAITESKLKKLKGRLVPLTLPKKEAYSPTKLEKLTVKEIYIPNRTLTAEELNWVEKIQESLTLATSAATPACLREKLALEMIEGGILGVNNSYFCKILTGKVDDQGSSEVVIGGVLKFGDEEAGTKRNLRKDITRSKYGISPGKSYARECIASALHPERIPCTIKITFLAENGQERLASLQRFIPEARDLHTVDIVKESMNFPEEEVCEMALVDLRLVNTDRHKGNALIPKNSFSSLYLIDHGCVLSEGFQDKAVFCWSAWSRAELGFPEQYKERIAKIDIQNDRRICKETFPDVSEGVLKSLGLSTFLLQESAKADLSLRRIAAYYFTSENPLCSSSFAEILYKKINAKVASIEEFDVLAREQAKLAVKLVQEYYEAGDFTASLETFLIMKIAAVEL